VIQVASMESQCPTLSCNIIWCVLVCISSSHLQCVLRTSTYSEACISRMSRGADTDI